MEWNYKFNVDENCWEIKSGDRLIASLPVCMDGEMGKYETSDNLTLICGVNDMYDALKSIVNIYDNVDAAGVIARKTLDKIKLQLK